MKPKLLFLSHRLPFPPHSGADIRTYNVWRELARDWDIDAIVVHNRAEDIEALSVRERVSALSELGRVTLVPLESQQHSGRTLVAHGRAMLRGVPYLDETFRGKALSAAIDEKLGAVRYSAVHVDSIALLHALPRLVAIPLVLTHHNIESDLLARRAEHFSNSVLRWYLQLQSERLRAAEAAWAARVALNVCVSDDDTARLRKIAPAAKVVTIANAVDNSGDIPLTLAGRKATGIFVGGLNWFPNSDALEFYASEVEPLLHTETHAFETKWIGKASDAQVSAFRGHRSITVAGYVADLTSHMNSARVFIAPLRVGGGTRLKILDAWAAGIPVVATTLACEGLGAMDGVDLLIGDTPSEFARQVQVLLTNDDLWLSVASHARERLRAGFTWDSLGEQLRGHYRALLDDR